VTPRRVMFLSGAPGIGGGERGVMPSLAASASIDLVVVGPAPVAEYARSLGAEAITLDLRRAHKLVHGPRVAVGARRVQKLFAAIGADVLYANGTRAIPYAVGARLLGCRPLIFHHHGLLTDGPIRTLTFAVNRFADAVIAPSRVSAEPFIAGGKVHVIPYGIDVQRFAPVTASRAGDVCVVGSLTRPDPTKGMHDFIELARRMKSQVRRAEFVLGGGPVFPHEHKPYASVVADAASAGVRTTGHVRDTVPFYNALDVFVHLAGPEGFGLIVVEALACGVPVVAYDWGAIPEVFGGLVTLVPPGDIDAAAAAVDALLTNEQRRITEGARGRQAAEQRFTIDRMAAEIEAVVASAAAPQ
jgi:glycosyltransferase involved in cell wall biosynthesis